MVRYLALFAYGRRSEGKHRRLGPDGPRFIEDRDLNESGRPKVILNDPSLVMTHKLNFDPFFDRERWNQIYEATKRRGRSQRGIPRVKDPAKYPLACRVIDLTDGCNSIMYGRTSGNRALYTCGRYMKFGPSACENNQVDAEAMLRFTLDTLTELVSRLGGREVLRARLVERAQRLNTQAGGTAERRECMKARIAQLTAQKQQAGRNFALASDDALRKDAEAVYLQLKKDLESAESELARLGTKVENRQTPESEADKALALLDQIQRVAKDPTARAEVLRLTECLGLHIGLRFVGATKGKKRQVRQLAGGVFAFGNTLLQNDNGDPGGNRCPGHRCTDTENVGSFDGRSPALAIRPTEHHPEGGVSSTMVNRGDRRWTFPNEPEGRMLLLGAVTTLVSFTAAEFTACAIS